MNIYEKLQKMRVALQDMGIKKSGKNAYAGYSYYELSDITPPIMKLELEHKVCSLVTFMPDKAILTLVNTEKPDETITFESPMAEASLKGAHAIQNLGAVETYQRRYLYMMAYEVVEADVLDSTQGKDAPQQTQKKNNNLNAENSRKLNVAIKDYCSMAGCSTKVAMGHLSALLGWDVSQVTDANVNVVLDTLKNACY